MDHNNLICAYLNDGSKYLEYLQKQCKRLSKEREMSIIDMTFHKGTMKICSKLLLRNWVRLLRKKEISDDFSLRMLLRNDTRMNLLLRFFFKE